MKTFVIALRISEEEKKKLDFLAKKTNKNISDCAKYLMFEHEKKLDQIFLAIQNIQGHQKKSYAHHILISKSILQIRWVTSRIMHLLLKIYGKNLNSDYSFPSDQEKEQFIDGEMEKIHNEVEQSL